MKVFLNNVYISALFKTTNDILFTTIVYFILQYDIHNSQNYLTN